MSNFDVYKDIAERTGGDIYVGVVGPVRTGKSTFISKVLNTIVLPNITNTFDKERTIDEMPQSGDGKSIMTTQPKFVPNEAVQVTLDGEYSFNVRLVDCVGYLVDGAIGQQENGKPRLVKTPWSTEEMPFEKAAELGTNKVITKHSTIGVLVTSDGTITDLERDQYVDAEERVVKELKNCQKPFVIVLNSRTPKTESTMSLAKSLEEKYKTKVIATDILNASVNDMNEIFTAVLEEFAINAIDIDMPAWLQSLPFDHAIIRSIVDELDSKLKNVQKIGDLNQQYVLFEDSQYFEPNPQKTILSSEGRVVFTLQPKPDLFYQVLSENCGITIHDDYELVCYVKELSKNKAKFDKLAEALDQVEANGYGIVTPTEQEFVLSDPEAFKQGGKYGMKLKATAPSLHIMKVDVTSEVSPVVGNATQSEEMVKYLMEEFQKNPESFLETKMFGRSLYSLVTNDLYAKMTAMPQEIQKKMRKTMGRIINEGKGGVICILL